MVELDSHWFQGIAGRSNPPETDRHRTSNPPEADYKHRMLNGEDEETEIVIQT
jgi:hypothetical protein